jgi:hypothetical protein
LAACLLADLENTAALDDFKKRLSVIETDQRSEVVGWCLEAIRRYRLGGCLTWVKSLVDEPSTSKDLLPRCVLTLLELDVLSGLEAWNTTLGDQPAYQQRVRYGLLLLAGGAEVPPTSYDRIKGDSGEDLIDAIIDVGKTMSERRNPVEPLKNLIDLGHSRSTEWAMSYVKKLAPEHSEQIYAFLIDRIPNPKPEQTDSNALAMLATAKLFELKPELVFDRLRNAEDDSDMQQAILLGLFESNVPSIGVAAAKIRRIGSGRADCLALLLLAKHSKTLAAPDVEQLGKIAAGGGRLSPALQIQAAWLYLKHSGQKESALAKIFAN